MQRTSILSQFILLLIFFLSAATQVIAAERKAVAMPSRGVCAHRGASETHPENTLAAFREAVILGTQMIEFDVALTNDGRMVLIHDTTLDRTTNGKGNVSDLSFDEIRQLDAGRWKNEKFAGEKIPTLRETLNIMPLNIWLNVHLKGGVELAEKVAQAIVEADRTHQCFLACGSKAAAVATGVSPKIKICNMERQANSQQYVDETIAAGSEFIQLFGGDTADAALTAQLRPAGIRINFCCGNEAEKIKRLFDAGVEFPLVDSVAAMLKVADEQGIERLTPVYRSAPAKERRISAVFKDGEAQVVPAFEDDTLWIHHDLWVETEFDTDGDGARDRMHVSVTRQRQTDTQGLKVPVIYASSPYYAGIASGTRNFFWDPQHELGDEPPEHEAPPSIKQRIRRLVLSRSHQHDWLPRGFAVVHSSAPGTGLSQGCPALGGAHEAQAPKAVIDWLCGRARGFTTPQGAKAVDAFWSTGAVGMTGTSYNGTIALAAATTGVEGLKAVIPVAPVTSFYHYYRSNGLVRHPGGYIGEDMGVLYDYINSGAPDFREYCDCNVRDKELAGGFDRETGDFNTFWSNRDYLKDVGTIKASMLMSHAFNDWNVMPEHSVRILQAAKATGIPVQAYFHQGGHGGAPPMKMRNRWFTRYLYGVQNGVEKDADAWIVRENDDRQKPTAYSAYPNANASVVTLYPRRHRLSHGVLSVIPEAEQGIESFTDDFSQNGSDLATATNSKNRLLYATPTLTKPLHLSGTCRVTVRVACDKPAANLSVWLVSLPWTDDDSTSIHNNVVTRGWADPQNHESLTAGEPLTPGTFYDVSFDLQPDDQIVPAGQQIGLMIFSTDREFTLWPKPGTVLTVDLNGTQIQLPIVGGQQALQDAFATSNESP